MSENRIGVRKGGPVDASLSSLLDAEKRMLRDVLHRRDLALFERVARTETVSPSDAELIVSILSEEFIDNLDDNWEPTEYGNAISDLLQRVNAARLDET